MTDDFPEESIFTGLESDKLSKQTAYTVPNSARRPNNHNQGGSNHAPHHPKQHFTDES